MTESKLLYILLFFLETPVLEEYIQTKARINAPEKTEGNNQMQNLNKKYKHAILYNSETKHLKSLPTRRKSQVKKTSHSKQKYFVTVNVVLL